MTRQSLPDKSHKLAIQHVELGPISSDDSPSLWRRFIDAMRTVIGLKPIYLAEHFVKARVRQEYAKAFKDEADAQARLLKARQAYETAMHVARLAETTTKGQVAKDQAQARLDRSKAKVNETLARILAEHLTPQEAIERLKTTIAQIQMVGGVVEFDLPAIGSDKDSKAGGLAAPVDEE